MVNFILLTIMHVLGDFYLQTSKVAQCKNAKRRTDCGNCKECKPGSWLNLKYLIIHSALYAVPFVILCFFVGWVETIIVMLLLFVTHGVIDLGSCYFYKKEKQTVVFIIDQCLHILVLWCVYTLLPFNCDLSEYAYAIKLAFVGLTVVKPCSILINKLFEDIYPGTVNMNLFDIGSMIGIMERIMTVIFSCFNNFAAIAIIITVKTWARTNDLKEPEFRNKYLLGTLTSIVLALLIFLVYRLI